jgi:hypothetical protein
MSEPTRTFREINGVPLLGDAPPPQGERLRVLLTLEFGPDPVPPDRRLAQLLRVALRRFKARNLQCIDVVADGPPAAQGDAKKEDAR